MTSWQTIGSDSIVRKPSRRVKAEAEVRSISHPRQELRDSALVEARVS
jgi:hypothetical protein